MSCASVEDIKQNAMLDNELAAVSIDSVERSESYKIGNQTVTPKKPEKDNVIAIEASFVNNGSEKVTVAPYAAGLQPRIDVYGILPTTVGFSHPGEAFVNGLSGLTGESEFELDPGKADRRVFIFIFPKDREPDALELRVVSKENKPELWVTAPLKK